MGGHLEIGYGECWERGEPRPGGREKAKKKKNLKKLKRKGRHCQEVGPNAGQCHNRPREARTSREETRRELLPGHVR